MLRKDHYHSDKNRASLVHRDLRTPKYKPRVVRNKKKYTRKVKHTPHKGGLDNG